MTDTNTDYCNIDLKNNKINDFINKISNKILNKNSKLNKKYLLVLFILFVILLYLIIIYINPFNLVNINYSLFILFTILFIIILNYYKIVYNVDINISKIVYTILGIFLILFFIHCISLFMNKYFSKKTINLFKTISFVLISLIVIIKYRKIIINNLKNTKIINILNNIINNIVNNISSLYSNNTYSFKVISFSLLLLFVCFLPKIYDLIMDKINGSTRLLKQPIYLNNKKTINMNKFINLKNPNYHYGISFWYWINPQPPNTSYSYNKYTNIFNYGDKPSIEINPIKNKFRIKYKKNINNNELIYESSIISYQKWNNIFINFDGGNMDIFQNGELVASKPNIISKVVYDNLVIGENNGIHGGISNIIYYNKNIDSNTIKNNYNSLKNNKNPYR